MLKLCYFNDAIQLLLLLQILRRFNFVKRSEEAGLSLVMEMQSKYTKEKVIKWGMKKRKFPTLYLFYNRFFLMYPFYDQNESLWHTVYPFLERYVFS